MPSRDRPCSLAASSMSSGTPAVTLSGRFDVSPTPTRSGGSRPSSITACLISLGISFSVLDCGNSLLRRASARPPADAPSCISTSFSSSLSSRSGPNNVLPPVRGWAWAGPQPNHVVQSTINAIWGFIFARLEQPVSFRICHCNVATLRRKRRARLHRRLPSMFAILTLSCPFKKMLIASEI
jgi:hypothetical protein